jgi:hypothetical protein
MLRVPPRVACPPVPLSHVGLVLSATRSSMHDCVALRSRESRVGPKLPPHRWLFGGTKKRVTLSHFSCQAAGAASQVITLCTLPCIQPACVEPFCTRMYAHEQDFTGPHTTPVFTCAVCYLQAAAGRQVVHCVRLPIIEKFTESVSTVRQVSRL